MNANKDSISIFSLCDTCENIECFHFFNSKGSYNVTDCNGWTQITEVDFSCPKK